MALAALRRATPLTSTSSRLLFARTVHSPIKMSQRSFSSFLVSPKELSEALSQNAPTKISTAPRVIPLCASWFMPNDPQKRTGLQVFKEKRVPWARFFDLDAVKDDKSPYPHMLPSAEQFAEAMGALGLHQDDALVVYDSEDGIFSGPRVAWMLKIFSHPNVHLLNNFKLWVEQGYPTDSGEIEPWEKTEYPVPAFDSSKVVSFEQVKEIAQDYNKEGSEGIQILDARPYGRWAGTAPEPRPGLSSGHIPGSISLPFPELLDPQNKTLLGKDELRKIFESKGVDPEKSIISSCGTGVSAVIIDAALEEAGYGDSTKRKIYDGSWTEWAQRATEAEGLIKKESA
ncbi:Rhodanese-like protein [Xylona heveae TC161]|uniref:Rhodanese-like protein n=1 Tax=Xylona heveae (strain CBS 132557 / TC161) TaxID=1328760 RepID=A0A161TPN8_XYLHT|nr:Rhodanese-like protein [Xylona heveae TC161]KZF24206.1 Rhodanese-like protein [Xylona heveae TC161]